MFSATTAHCSIKFAIKMLALLVACPIHLSNPSEGSDPHSFSANTKTHYTHLGSSSSLNMSSDTKAHLPLQVAVNCKFKDGR